MATNGQEETSRGSLALFPLPVHAGTPCQQLQWAQAPLWLALPGRGAKHRAEKQNLEAPVSR